ncbi:MAG: hypothetical protein FWE88_09610 [Phycisphaerae bacterium]|nr:hypothetical protein [Phycisphaerae bacterium]
MEVSTDTIDAPPSLAKPASPAARSVRVGAWLALAAAVAATLLLGVRQLGSPDIGYHLAYGEEFWRTGRLVDHNPYVFTLPTAATAGADDLPPGCWYDRDGLYRFPNANWGTQVILAAIHTHLGQAALMWTLPVLVGIIVALVLLTMRRLKLPPLAMASDMLLLAIIAYERFILRPEMFSYVLLAAELFVLVGWQGRVRQIAALGLLQLALVNVHSYFLLGLALTGAFVLDALWRRQRDGLSPGLKPLLIAFGVQAACSVVNPWTWRLAVMPFQTLWFTREHNISGQAGPGGHPWSIIGEFYTPFGPFGGYWATVAYCVLLALAAAAVIVLAWRLWKARQDRPALLAWALVIVGMAAVSLSMRRNIAPFAMLATPLILASLAPQLHRLAAYLHTRRQTAWLLPAASLAVLATAVALASAVPGNRFYATEWSTARFGPVYSHSDIPIDACEFITKTLRPRDDEKIWCDYNVSSNVHYYTRPHPRVPLLTNTWAYPPSVMRTVLDASWATPGHQLSATVDDLYKPFADLYAKYPFEIVLLRVEGMTWVLAYSLAHHADWAMVYVDARYAVFVRRDGRYASRLDELDLTPARIADRVPGLLAAARSRDLTGNDLYWASITLHTVGHTDHAIAAIRQAIELRPALGPFHARLGQLLAMHANALAAQEKNFDARRLLEQAVDALETATKLDNDAKTKAMLHLAREQLQTLKNGQRIMPVRVTM